MSQVVSPKAIADSLTELWSPRVVAEVDDAYVKVAKVKGKLTWHAHDNEDELFFILKGRLRIELESSTVELREGEAFVVPKGVQRAGAVAPALSAFYLHCALALHLSTRRRTWP